MNTDGGEGVSLIENAEKLNRLLGLPQSQDNAVNISVNAGGVGIWVSTTCCIVMVVVSILAGMVIVAHEAEQQQRINAHEADQQRKIDELYNYISAIYAQAPQLKPKEQSE